MEEPASTARTASPEPPSVSHLIGDITRDMSLLARQEVKLAKAEMQHNVHSVGRALGLVVLGAALLTGALMLLLQAAVAALQLEMPVWAASLIVGGIVIVFAVAILLTAKTMLSASSMQPTRTLNELDRDRELVKSQITKEHGPS